LAVRASVVRLPTEAEWEKLAGGVVGGRYPWDALGGPATQEEPAILARANTEEAQLNGTSPVAMYLLGASQPFGLMDLAGNVWEWTATVDRGRYVLRGGAWYWEADLARCGSRNGYNPSNRNNGGGFRLVSPIVSGS
jgi:formylglycine-generating enzyme required for sulfatase activity